MSLTPQRARAHLKARGWTYRSAGPALGVHYSHVCLVLCGRRKSRRLLARIAALPAAPTTHPEGGR